MARFNTRVASTVVSSPVTSEATPSGQTYEGAPGYARSAKSELFLLAVAYMGSDNTFYETGKARDTRFADLVRQVATEDPAWITGFIPWLRNDANMRTGSVVAAAEAARALLSAGKPGGRKIIASALQRADEPGELLAYWQSLYGRTVPKPVKRGIGDALFRLFTEYPLLKYDTGSHAYRFADILALVHPGDRKGSSQAGRFQGDWQHDLFGYAIGRRYGRDEPPATLRMIAANRRLREEAGEDPSSLLDAGRLREAGMTWEDALSMAGSKVSKKDLWSALIPVMGFMGQLRNLRNFDEAGVPDEAAAGVIARFTSPEQVAKSRQFPFRFLSAYRAAPSLRWAYPLERALNLSLANVPALKGRTLVLVDRSLSMWEAKMSAHSEIVWADAAAIFGAAVALRAERADLVEFASRPAPVKFGASESLLKIIERFHRGNDQNGPVGTGTDIPRAVRDSLRPDCVRVVIVTDEQSEPGMLPSNIYGHFAFADAMPPTRIDDLIPQSVPVYVWNIGGYKHGVLPSGHGNRHLFGGLTDSAFRMMSVLEMGNGNARYPWEEAAA